MFQVAFAATAATIVSGAMAERTKFKAYLVYSFVISLIIYPVVVRWEWGGGWLLQLDTPFHDFAGSTIVHMTGGVAAFWGAKVLGPRIGKYGPDGKPRAILGHNVPFAMLGCFILLVGLVRVQPRLRAGGRRAPSAAIAVTTTLAGAAGALGAMATVWIRTGKPDVGMTGNGLLAGLVGITAGAAAVTGPYADPDRLPGRHPRRVRRRVLREGASRSTTRWAPSRSTACAVRSARSAWACSPARTSRASGSRACCSAAAPTSSSARSSASSSVAGVGVGHSLASCSTASRHTIGLRVSRGGGARRASTSSSTARPATARASAASRIDSPLPANGDTDDSAEEEPVPA